MRRSTIGLLVAMTATLGACTVGADDDRRYVDRETVYSPYPVYRGGSVYGGYPSNRGWGGWGWNDRRYVDRRYDDDDDRYTRAPWNGQRREGRFDREGKDTVCDRRTEICYKDGHIDKTETAERFGNKASRRADEIRDRYDNRNVYVPRRNVACDGDRNVCLKNGKRDVQATRKEFGNKAARELRGQLNNGNKAANQQRRRVNKES